MGGPQSGWPVAIFYSFRHPTLYAYANFFQFNNKELTWPVRSRAKLKITIKAKIGQVWINLFNIFSVSSLFQPES
jgi:hypothetical protein